MKKRHNIFAVVGGAVVLGITYVLASVVAIVSVALPFEISDRQQTP